MTVGDGGGGVAEGWGEGGPLLGISRSNLVDASFCCCS